MVSSERELIFLRIK